MTVRIGISGWTYADWRGGAFFYNRSVNNFSNVRINNVYNKTVVVNNTTNVSYNGGTGGTTVRPTAQLAVITIYNIVLPTALAYWCWSQALAIYCSPTK